MKIGIVGAGIIGRTLGQRLEAAGHEVAFGSREPADGRYDDLRVKAPILSVEVAVEDAELVIVAIPGAGVPHMLETYHGVLDGCLIVDATNDTAGTAFHHLADYETQTPNARVFRAFNTLGWENFADPSFGGECADLFYSGPESDRDTIDMLIGDIGLRPVFVGEGLAAANLLDGITRLWFALQRRHGRHIAFRLLGT